jgi:hypothetical protein
LIQTKILLLMLLQLSAAGAMTQAAPGAKQESSKGQIAKGTEAQQLWLYLISSSGVAMPRTNGESGCGERLRLQYSQKGPVTFGNLLASYLGLTALDDMRMSIACEPWGSKTKARTCRLEILNKAPEEDSSKWVRNGLLEFTHHSSKPLDPSTILCLEAG